MSAKPETATDAKFDHVRLLKLLEGVKSSLPDIDPEIFLKAIAEFVKIFNFIGAVSHYAFKDIDMRIATIRHNYIMFPEVRGGLISFIEHEKLLGVQLVNTEHPNVAPPSAKFKKYDSTTRTLSRLMWFFDFITMLMSNFVNYRTAKSSECARKAYDEALAHHHPLPVRVAIRAAVKFVPSRERFFTDLFPADVTEEEKYRLFEYCLELIAPIREFLWKYYTENGLKDIP